MISLLAPSKTLDFDTPAPSFVMSEKSLFQKQAGELARKLASLNHADMKQLMQVSDALADNTTRLYEKWGGHTKASAMGVQR